ncbi:MAG: HD domain-containing protein [Oscillospiraceae bacterium]|nr:HD domain-containing protein [Oscillospiraceae bacterium]
MTLPEHILVCISRLEAAGFEAYAVGGCVRDDRLGRTPHDFDLCTSALPEQTEAVFAGYPLLLEGKKHGTVCVVLQEDVVEITTFRQEGAYSDNRHPDWVRFVREVEADLARRDFTVNAMAWSPLRGYADPFGGRQDLQNNLLRTVGDPMVRFREDPLRILRGIRFASRYAMQVEPDTMHAMQVLAPLIGTLAKERIYDEMCRILPLLRVEDVIRFAPVFGEVIPEMKPMIGFDQKSPHHAYDLYTHTAYVVAAVPEDLTLRWAAFLHDVGKIPSFTQDETGRGHYYGHAGTGAQLSAQILSRMKAPAQLSKQVSFLIENHMARLVPDKKILRRKLSCFGWDMVQNILLLQEADMNSKGVPEELPQQRFVQIRKLLEEIRRDADCLSLRELAVNGRDLMALGICGKEVGSKLQELLEQVMDDPAVNNRKALLSYLQKQISGENPRFEKE